MIEISIRKRLADFTLEVDVELRAKAVAIFGPSGGGKSTLLRAVAGLVRPETGRIALDGRVLFDSDAGVNLPPERRGLGLVPQDGLLFPHRTMRENLLYGYRRVRGRPRTIELDEVTEVLEIGHLLDRFPATLSGGESQRAALGRALLASPLLLLFDEPLASIDVALKSRILPYLQRALSHFGIPALYVSHDQREATRIASTILVLHRGRVLACGPYLEIIDLPPVYGAFGREGVSNVVQATVLANMPERGYSETQIGRARFKVPPMEEAEGTLLSLSVRANDIILAREKPSRISARNILRGMILRLADVGDLLLAHVDVGCELLVELTPEAARELELAPNADVWVLIKSNAFSSEPELK